MRGKLFDTGIFSSQEFVYPCAAASYSRLHEGKGKDNRWSWLLAGKSFAKSSHFPVFKNGTGLTTDWMKSTGFRLPVLILDPDGLDMKMPPTSLSVSDVADSVGREKIVEVLHVPTQTDRRMTLEEWALYFDQPESQRNGILNVPNPAPCLSPITLK